MSVTEIAPAFGGPHGEEAMRGGRASAKLHQAIRVYGVLMVLVVLFVVLAGTAPGFISLSNQMEVMKENAPLFALSFGTTFVIVSGAFDLSCGQIVSLSGVVGAWVGLHVGGVPGVLIGVAVGIPAGILNGLLVTRLNLNSFLATLASGLVFGGLAYWLTAGQSIYVNSTSFNVLGSSSVGVVPVPVIVVAGLFIVLSVVMHSSVFGRYLFAVGSNAEAARLSGVRVSAIRVGAYAIGGFAAALGGLIYTTGTGVGNLYPGTSALTLYGIAAVVLGGTSIAGGKGALWRTLVGVLLLSYISNAFSLLNVQPYWQDVVSGAVIVLGLVANRSSS